MEEFTLRKGSEFIELSDLLKVLGICETGGMAKMMIAEGLVRVNSSVELRKRRKLRAGDRVEYKEREVVVA
jgi:ribosome-associated protein